jgi:hypothetical protein
MQQILMNAVDGMMASGAYKIWSNEDLIRPIIPLMTQSGNYYMGADGKIHTAVWGVQPDTPWVHAQSDDSKDCGLWHQIMFDY